MNWHAHLRKHPKARDRLVHILRSIRSSGIRSCPIKPGRVGVSSQFGCANCLRTEKLWTIAGFRRDGLMQSLFAVRVGKGGGFARARVSALQPRPRRTEESSLKWKVLGARLFVGIVLPRDFGRLISYALAACTIAAQRTKKPPLG